MPKSSTKTMKTNLLNVFAIFILLILCLPTSAQVGGIDKLVIFDKTPPFIQWIDPIKKVSSREFSLILELSRSSYPISKLKTRLNKQNWKEKKDPFSPDKAQETQKQVDEMLRGKGKSKPFYKDAAIQQLEILPFSLKEGNNEIEISVTNQGQITTDTIFTIFYEPTVVSLPILHLITIGVGSYKFDNIKSLSYPAKDAIAIDSIFTHQGKLYKGVKKYHLTDNDATKQAITSLIADVKKSVKENDAIIAFFSGHGDKDILTNITEQEIRFMPHDFDKEDKENTGILNSYIINQITSMHCNSFIIFDACYSGSLLTSGLVPKSSKSPKKMSMEIKRRLKKNKKENVILNASAKEAFEHLKWRHGALTKALLEAFEGQIDQEFMPSKENERLMMSENGKKYIPSHLRLREISKDGFVDAKELLEYVNHRVRELVSLQNGKQEPVFKGKGNFFLYQIHK